MNKESIYNDFLNLNFNRITKKQKLKARDYIINSLKENYDLDTVYGISYNLGFFPHGCYNIESNNHNYEILLTAHYDTHGLRQNYISAYLTRKIQYSNWIFKILYLVLFIKIVHIFTVGLKIVLDISEISSFLIYCTIVILALGGVPTCIINLRQRNLAPIHDDNNSGVISLIYIGKLLYEKGYSDKIKLLFTDCEEKGLLGSKLFINKNLEDLQNKIIINLDCVGRGTNLFITAENNSKIAEELQCYLSSKGINSTLFTKSFSDDRNFQKKGLNSIGIIRADKSFNDNKLLHWTHTSHDTLDNINLDYMEEMIKSITEFIEFKINDLE